MGLRALAVVTGGPRGATDVALRWYAAFQALLTWLWYVVRREDLRDHPEFLAPARRYVTGIALSATSFRSAFPPDGRARRGGDA